MVGERHGPLILERMLGVGAVGSVYLAMHPPTGTRFAVKLLHPHMAAKPAVRARFLAEAQAASRIIHRNVVRVLDVRPGPRELPTLLMEYAEGEPLSFLPVPLAPVDVITLLIQVLEGLDAAHAHGVVHRDLKPDNLLLTRDAQGQRQVKVLDFGMASVLAASCSQQELASGVLLGSPAYMAPEQWAGAAPDPRMDVYALGVIAYRLLTGQLPFGRGHTVQGRSQQQQVRPLAPHTLDARISQVLSLVVLQAIAYRPEERFPTARDFQLALVQAQRHVARPTLKQYASVPPAQVGSAEPQSDPELAQLLARTAVLGKDPYVFLGLPPSASFDEVRQRADSALRRLEAFWQRPLPSSQRQELERLRARVEAARRTLGDPLTRASFDASKGNVHGIARCIAAGLTEEAIEPIRRVMLAARPGTEAYARSFFIQAHSLEVQNALKPALDCYAQALAMDPLNLVGQRRYWALQRRMRPMTTSIPAITR
jgi:serine/threonine protein kinase